MTFLLTFEANHSSCRAFVTRRVVFPTPFTQSTSISSSCGLLGFLRLTHSFGFFPLSLAPVVISALTLVHVVNNNGVVSRSL